MASRSSGTGEAEKGRKEELVLTTSSSYRYGSMTYSLASSATTPATTPTAEGPVLSTRRSYAALAVLCYLNLLNFMERYTIAVFICSFILLAPLFGYLGDRYNRKWIMISGLSVWLVTTACGSFVNKSYFWVLVLMRALVGTGEASFATIAPTMIGDMFSGGRRTIAISLFYLVLPVGCGLGYVIGSSIATATGDWRWALRICPILGAVGVVLLILVCPNPRRGASEARGQVVAGPSSYMEDIKYLLKNRAQVAQGSQQPCLVEPCDTSESFVFGTVTVVSGMLGVGLGTALSRCLIVRVPNVDPIICAVGMLGCIPCFLAAIFLATRSIPVTYLFIFFGETLLSVNWPIIGDIVLYVVVPTRRATANALQIMVCHLLGDAASPYIIGLISDALSASDPDSPQWRFHSLQYSLLCCPLVAVLGGGCYLVSARYIAQDRKAAQPFSPGLTCRLVSLGARGEWSTQTLSVIGEDEWKCQLFTAGRSSGADKKASPFLTCQDELHALEPWNPG
ncbi:hypothetical protein NHX12_010751 [Muraenolepis orangiensis]|uniref:Major facilitator superfamily (MFS) profile domain-containing protein n=1 Tax=Muraenolepis orangiensis TaxID=630683 RepID=A0A9Q0DMU6_9TELE|nr:hypothetical protein NHX12_010751 [Muraenolepis orangiensis]